MIPQKKAERFRLTQNIDIPMLAELQLEDDHHASFFEDLNDFVGSRSEVRIG